MSETIEWVPNPARSEASAGWPLSGLYKVVFDDGYAVMVPHMGFGGPLNLTVTGDRERVVSHARHLRAESEEAK